jgi:hypothetical protein
LVSRFAGGLMTSANANAGSFVFSFTRLFRGSVMKGFVRGALIAAIALPFAAMDAAAQAYRFDVGLKGGGAFWTKTLSDDELGENTEDVKFKQGWLTGADLLGPRPHRRSCQPGVHRASTAPGAHGQHGYGRRQSDQ